MRDEKYKPFSLLVPASFEGYVDDVSSGASDTPTTPTTTTGDAKSRFADAIVDKLMSDDKVQATDIREISMNKDMWSKEDRKVIVKLRTNIEFLTSIAEDNGASWDHSKGVMTL